jgi:hypothetical protein
VDEKLVSERVRAVSDLQAAGVRAMADHRLALRKLLTPEQQEKLRSFRREGRGERGLARRRVGASPRRGMPGQGGPRVDARDPGDDPLMGPGEPVQ